ncbi:Allantoinase [Rubripirellula obstinata]|uniref:allantoinase n=1 Tax=Rubripirellula obstinata TaxID=406547 RepID=A0A5B1CH56_9BACT|nr:allantoinase AllB [Rubripirellula obstinata]KAA1259532.1 Allantoinase [Rubripirellula obstinata]
MGEQQPAVSKPVFAICSTRVVTASGEINAAIIVEGEVIRAVVDPAEVPAGLQVINVGDLVVSPGIIDAHVHVNEPGRTKWEGFETATAAAAAGGVTTIIDMPLNSSPVTTTKAALKKKQAAASEKCAVDVGFYAGLVPGNHHEIASLVEEGVMGVKAFLCDSGLDEFPASSESDLREGLRELQSTGVPLLAHAEIVGKQIQIDHPQAYHDYANSRPPEFELAAIELLIDLCREYQTPIHIVHLATAKALPVIVDAKLEGLPITVETCPHYLYFDSAQIQDGETRFKCAPPIRDRANRDALRDAVEAGIIETVGSDHSPCPSELKAIDSGDFSKAWGGIASLQLTQSVMWTIALDRGWSPVLLAERLSWRPAQIFGLQSSKGRIEAGYDADFVIWDPSATFQVSGAKLFHRGDVTAYEGCNLQGIVKHTYLRGTLIYEDGSLIGDRIGKFVRRESPQPLSGFLNSLEEQELFQTLETCCGSREWVNRMIGGGKFTSDSDLLLRAKTAWEGLREPDLLEAFSAHPRIGDIDSLRAKFANTKSIAENEQAGVKDADEEVLKRLSAANDEYFDKFGFIFIVCATGKTSRQMLQILEERLVLSRDQELKNAAAEQLKITELRLGKLIV